MTHEELVERMAAAVSLASGIKREFSICHADIQELCREVARAALAEVAKAAGDDPCVLVYAHGKLSKEAASQDSRGNDANAADLRSVAALLRALAEGGR